MYQKTRKSAKVAVFTSTFPHRLTFPQLRWIMSFPAFFNGLCIHYYFPQKHRCRLKRPRQRNRRAWINKQTHAHVHSCNRAWLSTQRLAHRKETLNINYVFGEFSKNLVAIIVANILANIVPIIVANTVLFMRAVSFILHWEFVHTLPPHQTKNSNSNSN